MRRVVLGALLCGALSGGVAALEGQVESPDTLKAFTGIWAHSEDDCQKKMSGALDRGDLDRVQTSSYELVGIYEDGLDMLYQPVNCLASNIGKQEDVVEFRASCRIKDNLAGESERVLARRRPPASDSGSMVFPWFIFVGPDE